MKFCLFIIELMFWKWEDLLELMNWAIDTTRIICICMALIVGLNFLIMPISIMMAVRSRLNGMVGCITKPIFPRPKPIDPNTNGWFHILRTSLERHTNMFPIQLFQKRFSLGSLKTKQKFQFLSLRPSSTDSDSQKKC